MMNNFSPTVIEVLKTIPKENNTVYIGATHIISTANLSIAPETAK